jgi:hypothetical protein
VSGFECPVWAESRCIYDGANLSTVDKKIGRLP